MQIIFEYQVEPNLYIAWQRLFFKAAETAFYTCFNIYAKQKHNEQFHHCFLQAYHSHFDIKQCSNIYGHKHLNACFTYIFDAKVCISFLDIKSVCSG